MGQQEWQGIILNQRLKNRENYMQGPKSSPKQWQTYVLLFKRFLAGKKNPRILVLGSTPELRDLALSYPDAELIAVDSNAEMVEKMTALMEHKNSEREKFINADWLNMPLPENSVDLIVGDGAVANLAAESFDDFFAQCRKILKPDGAIILRENVRIKEYVWSVTEIVAKSRQENWHWFDLYSYSYVSSTGEWFDEKTSQVNMEKYFTWVKQAYQDGLLNEEEFSHLWPWHGNLIHTFLKESEFLALFSKYFQSLPVCQPDDLRYHKFSYFFAGQPKV